MQILYVFGSEAARTSWLRGGHISGRCKMTFNGEIQAVGGRVESRLVYDLDSMRSLQGRYYDVVLMHGSFHHVLQQQPDLGWDEFVRLCLLRR